MKTQMGYAVRAWRKETKRIWPNWQSTEKQKRKFCREQADTSVDTRQRDDEPLWTCQEDADYSIREELTYWED